MRTVTAYATESARSPFRRTSIVRREVGPNDILIRIAYAGICHSDIHTAREEWGAAAFPLVPGHEIAGVVQEVGSAVTKHAVGDRVGVGCLVDSCGECRHCRSGNEQYCSGLVGTYGGIGRDGLPTQGGYSTHIVVTEGFVLRIPDAIPLDRAAPLLCAGITTYSPLRHWSVGPGSRVAVIGLGGLGHMGVKFARALGAEVTVFTRTDAKQEDALKLGAHSVRATDGGEAIHELRESFDVVLNTVSASLDLENYLDIVGVDGTWVNVGAPELPYAVPAFSLITKRRSFVGSMIGGIAETQEMLDVAAQHGLGADVEVIGGDQIDAAWERVVAGDVRYRFVIDTEGFDA